LSLRTICSGVCLRLAIVNILPSPTIVGNGLSSRVDQPHGVRPNGRHISTGLEQRTWTPERS
jgi:hypothetical protein